MPAATRANVGSKPSRSKARVVRCLGPRPHEHTFKSSNPVTVRVCKKCREALARLGTSARDKPCRVAEAL